MRAFLLVLAALAACANGYAVTPGSSRRVNVKARATPSMRLGSFGGIGKFGGGHKSWPSIRRGNIGGSDAGVGGGSGGDVSDPGSTGPSDDEPERGPLGNIWAGYNTMLEEQPILTKALTSLTGFAIGDILVQLFIEKKETFDWVRFLRFSSFGALIHGARARSGG